jgi:hypothetical protein
VFDMRVEQPQQRFGRMVDHHERFGAYVAVPRFPQRRGRPVELD